MPKFTIPVEWSVAGNVDVYAETLEDAIKSVNDKPLSALEDSTEYIDGSFKIQKEVLQELNPTEDLTKLSQVSQALLEE